jgi:2-polyprenyl-6-methoxyphenol hydroxylase-like FAD-dependent oxidoreductase
MAKTVLIVGASFSGVAAARELHKTGRGELNIILVDPREYVDFNWMNPRLLQEPESHVRTLTRLRVRSRTPWPPWTNKLVVVEQCRCFVGVMVAAKQIQSCNPKSSR